MIMDSLLKVKVVPNGPLKVEGTLVVELADGTREVKENGTYLCRCGHSNKKPFCDGMHRKMRFQD
jgi:CDGSH-type Zn-finger protein